MAGVEGVDLHPAPYTSIIPSLGTTTKSEGANYKDQFERVICPTIHTKYVTIRCNLNNEIQKTYKSKCIQMRMKFLNITNNDLKLILSCNR